MERLGSAFTYAEWVLERVDPTQRLTHVAIAASLSGGDYLAWRTQREQDASPNMISGGMASGRERPPVSISWARAALRLDWANLVEDLLVTLRRHMKSQN